MRATALPVVIDRHQKVGLPLQLADQIRQLILSRRAAPGTLLPSSRRLAVELGVSRAVTEQAYAQLVAEGWLDGRHGSGTYVAAIVPTHAGGADISQRAGSPYAVEPSLLSAGALMRLDPGTPWVDPRHRALWRRAWRVVAASSEPVGYDDSQGLPELRELLADRLRRTRGLDVHADEVIVTSGTGDAIVQLLAALPPGPVAVEDPGYRAAVRLITGVGRQVLDLPAASRDVLPGGAVAAYVTPAHQHPLGHTMSAGQRAELLRVATTLGTVVIEDDYDSEFRYDVAPVPALASLARDRVAYLGTASKSVSPSLRIGWLVAPRALHGRIAEWRRATHQAVPWSVQLAFQALLRDGYVDAVVRSARRVYSARVEQVAASLHTLGDVNQPVAGMYATVVMSANAADAARDRARRAGYDVPMLSDYCRTSTLAGLVVGFGGITDSHLERALAALRPPART